MPRRSERGEYSEAFTGNPFAGHSNQQVYKALRWGDEPNDEWAITAEEGLASLGELAQLKTAGGRVFEEWGDDDGGPFVAVGQQTNRVYLIPRADDDGPIRKIPPFRPRQNPQSWRKIGLIRQIDYYSTKAGEDAYYYHEHQRPLPTLWEHRRTGVCVLVPASNRGKKSYGVVKEGIVG